MKKGSLTIICALIGLTIITVHQYFKFNDGKLHVVMCSVGQGEAIYIRTPTGSDVLIDSGPDKSVLSCLSRHMPYYDRIIDTLILTNADLDHYGGFKEVIYSYRIKQFITTSVGKNDEGFEALEKVVEEYKIPAKIMDQADIVRDNTISFTSVWPERNSGVQALFEQQEGRAVLGSYAVSGSVNVHSLVLKLTYGEFDMLLTGDIVPPGTDEMSEVLCCHPGEPKATPGSDSGQARMTRGRVEVLKVPHHGSKNGLTKKLLDVTQPKLALISAGKRNKFGHPSKETLRLLEEGNVQVIRTDQVGDIEIISDGKAWTIK